MRPFRRMLRMLFRTFRYFILGSGYGFSCGWFFICSLFMFLFFGHHRSNTCVSDRLCKKTWSIGCSRNFLSPQLHCSRCYERCARWWLLSGMAFCCSLFLVGCMLCCVVLSYVEKLVLLFRDFVVWFVCRSICFAVWLTSLSLTLRFASLRCM